MEIRNKTLYDKDLIVNYNKYYLGSYIKRNFIVITAISLVFIIYMLVIQEWAYAGLLFGILGFYLGLTALMQKQTMNRMLKRSPLVEQPVLQTYLFMDEEFEVHNIKSYNMKYSDIIKYRKAKLFYLLHSVDRKTFIIDIKGFDSEPERLSFEDKMASLFIKKKR